MEFTPLKTDLKLARRFIHCIGVHNNSNFPTIEMTMFTESSVSRTAIAQSYYYQPDQMFDIMLIPKIHFNEGGYFTDV